MSTSEKRASLALACIKGSCGKWFEKAEHFPSESTRLCPILYFAQSRTVEAASAKKSAQWSKTEEEGDGLISVPDMALSQSHRDHHKARPIPCPAGTQGCPHWDRTYNDTWLHRGLTPRNVLHTSSRW